MARDEALAAIERFRRACHDDPLVVAAFLGGSYAAGSARDESDIDLYVVTDAEHHAAFVADRERFMRSWGRPTRLEHVRNFEDLGFDMIVFDLQEGVRGEVAIGHTANFRRLHGGPHEALVDKTGLLDGVSFPML